MCPKRTKLLDETNHQRIESVDIEVISQDQPKKSMTRGVSFPCVIATDIETGHALEKPTMTRSASNFHLLNFVRQPRFRILRRNKARKINVEEDSPLKNKDLPGKAIQRKVKPASQKKIAVRGFGGKFDEEENEFQKAAVKERVLKFLASSM